MKFQKGKLLDQPLALQVSFLLQHGNSCVGDVNILPEVSVVQQQMSQRSRTKRNKNREAPSVWDIICTLQNSCTEKAISETSLLCEFCWHNNVKKKKKKKKKKAPQPITVIG